MAESGPPRVCFAWREFTGAFGDLGTLLPLVLGLVIYNGIAPGPAFVLLGLSYILAGLYYRLPVPVQPLKATAMIAIATGATRPQIAAAALLVAAILLVLAATRLVEKMDTLFPRMLVRGLQLGLGVLMIRTGAKLAMHCFGGVGSTITGVHSPPAGLFPSVGDFQVALTALVLPQIPLTLGNSIVATRDCTLKYFGEGGERVTAGRLAATISLGNIAAGLVGGVPICHGAGGMTAHYRLGARTGTAPAIMGSVLLVVGLFGQRLLPVVSSIPAVVLGLLLVYVGIRHVGLARSELMALRTAVVVAVMAVLSYITGNMLLALAGGVFVKALAIDTPAFIAERGGAK